MNVWMYVCMDGWMGGWMDVEPYLSLCICIQCTLPDLVMSGSIASFFRNIPPNFCLIGGNLFVCMYYTIKKLLIWFDLHIYWVENKSILFRNQSNTWCLVISVYLNLFSKRFSSRKDLVHSSPCSIEGNTCSFYQILDNIIIKVWK